MSALFPTTLSTGDWLMDTAAAVTLLIALVLLVRGPVARMFGPRLAYALWLLPLARAVMPGITLTVEAPEASPPLDAATLLVQDAMTAPPISAPIGLHSLLLWLWLGGALLLAAHATLAYARLRRAIATDGVPVGQEGKIALVESAAVDGPVALGIFRPLVALPKNFASVFGPAEQRHVIAHELEHHRGADLVINLAAFALLALNWFNPIAWAGWRAFRQDQEAACDARTLDRLGATNCGDRAAYGRTIAVAVAGPMLRSAPAFALAMGQKSALIYRLRSLAMSDITPRRRWLGRAALGAVALLALPLTATVSYAVQTPSPPPAPPAEPSSQYARHITRVVRDGQTITLMSDHPLDPAEVERMVADAQADRATAEGARATAEDAAGAEGRRETRRIIIRTNAEGGLVPPIPPVPPVPPVNIRHRSETAFVYRHDGDASAADVRTSCDDDPTAERIERTTGTSDGQHTLRVVRCGGGDAAMRLSALRHARASLAAMPEANLPAEARRSSLAELDALISEAERAAGQ